MEQKQPWQRARKLHPALQIPLKVMWVVAYLVGGMAVIAAWIGMMSMVTFGGDELLAVGLMFFALIWFVGLWLIARKLWADRWPDR
jgi:predicted lipid-binding transport protein (Tim44 family)